MTPDWDVQMNIKLVEGVLIPWWKLLTLYKRVSGFVLIIVAMFNAISLAPPTAVTLLVSLSSLSPATCSGTVSVAWTLEASDRD